LQDVSSWKWRVLGLVGIDIVYATFGFLVDSIIKLIADSFMIIVAYYAVAELWLRMNAKTPRGSAWPKQPNPSHLEHRQLNGSLPYSPRWQTLPGSTSAPRSSPSSAL